MYVSANKEGEEISLPTLAVENCDTDNWYTIFCVNYFFIIHFIATYIFLYLYI